MNDEIEQVGAVYTFATEYLQDNGPKLIIAIIILIVGVIIAGKVANLILNLLLKRDIDVTLSNFAASTLKIIIITMVAIMALGKLGIPVTPFAAAIGALGLGAGLALQGLLSNYGAGISIIVSRPFVVGDTVSLLGVSGIVKEVKLSHTILTNEDNVIILIPNRHIVGEIIHNSHADSIVELTVGIAYHCKPQQAIDLISTALEGLEGLSEERKPIVGIENFGDSSIDIGIRFWAQTEHYYHTLYRANNVIHQALEAGGIDIPFPQRDVRLIQSSDQAKAS